MFKVHGSEGMRRRFFKITLFFFFSILKHKVSAVAGKLFLNDGLGSGVEGNSVSRLWNCFLSL